VAERFVLKPFFSAFERSASAALFLEQSAMNSLIS